MWRQPRAGETEGAARQCAEDRLTNFLSRPSGELGYELEGGADQNAEGRLTNFLSRPCVDSPGQVTVKEMHASKPRIA